MFDSISQQKSVKYLTCYLISFLCNCKISILEPEKISKTIEIIVLFKLILRYQCLSLFRILSFRTFSLRFAFINEILLFQANVMLTYPIDEALELLTKNYNTAVKNLASVNNDLAFLRDQFTTTEVNMARVYNWDVKQRRKNKEKTDRT